MRTPRDAVLGTCTQVYALRLQYLCLSPNYLKHLWSLKVDS